LAFTILLVSVNKFSYTKKIVSDDLETQISLFTVCTPPFKNQRLRNDAGQILFIRTSSDVYPAPFAGSNLIYSLKSQRYSSYKQRVCLSFIIWFCQELLNDLLHFNFIFIFKHINHIVAYLTRMFSQSAENMGYISRKVLPGLRYLIIYLSDGKTIRCLVPKPLLGNALAGEAPRLPVTGDGPKPGLRAQMRSQAGAWERGK
jgi:hypothetical protein